MAFGSVSCVWTAFALWCLQITAAGSPSFQQRNYNTVKAIYNQTIYPNNQAFLKRGPSALPPGLFSANATGRITPIGNFSGLEESIEYFFGLAPPVQPPLYDTWTSAKLVSFSSGCPEVASSVVYGETTGVNPNASSYGQTISTVKQIAFWRFDGNGAVTRYEAWLPSLRLYTELLYGSPQTPEYEALKISAMCNQTQILCTGANQQFNSTQSCVSTLSAKPFGDFDEVWGDNVHVLLAAVRLDMYCAHVGPSGGGKCVDVFYNEVYFDDQALYGVPAGGRFVCSGIQI